MKKILIIVTLGVAMIFISGCIGTNQMTYNQLNQTEVNLSQKNFHVVGTAEGSYTNSYVFGLGGASKSAMRENAVQQMFRNANLKGSQTIINVSYSTSRRTILFIYSEQVVTAFGTIIEFDK